MSKALITNKIYLEGLTKNQYDSIVHALTYKIPKAFNPNANRFSKFVPAEVIKNYKLLPKNILAIPQSRVDLIPEGYEIVDKRTAIPVTFPEPMHSMYENQQEVYDAVEDNCIINAVPGWGKTFTALHLAKKLGQKTLIIVHTLFLRDQWKNSIKDLFGIDCGIIGSGVMDYKDHAITVANVQTLNKHLNILGKEWGLVITDECLDYETMIETLEVGPVKLGKIVNQNIPYKVLSFNTNTNKVEYKNIVNFYKNKETNCLKIKVNSNNSLKCTANHNVYVWKDSAISKVTAEQLQVGDYLLQSKVGHKSNAIINKEWYPIILGLILGDGSLRLDNPKANSCRLRITHGQDQYAYLDWKSAILDDDVNILDGKSGYCKDRAIRSITSKSFIDVEGWKSALYGTKSNKSSIPGSIADILTKESWAIMYQDDGSSSADNSLVFSFCELDLISLDNLGNSLKKLFNIEDPKIFTCKKGFNYIRLNKDDSLLFKRGIANLVHPSMRYKLVGLDLSKINFEFSTPSVPIFNTEYCIRQIVSIEPSTLTGGYRYNIEVEDNHNYFANSLLVANCHHSPSTTFTTTINNFHARYKLGLSGTLSRKDGKQILFKDCFGTNVILTKGENRMIPSVKVIHSGFATDASLGWADRITGLLSNSNYQNFIADLAQVFMLDGHCVLILGDRVEFLDNLGTLIGDRCAVITGKTKDRESIVGKTLSGEFDCIAASTKIFSEGISVNRLSCVILAGPINNDSLLEQIIGRVQRFFTDKLNPLVIDIQFSGYGDRKQNESRYGFYMRKGWDIETI